MKDIKKILRYLGLAFFIVGGICLLMTIAELASYLGSLSLFSSDGSISGIVNYITVSVLCFIVGWICVDFLQ